VRPEPKVNKPTPPRELFKRFYFDALTHDAQAARYLIDQVGANRVVIGTDNPFDMAPDDIMGSIDAIPGLTASEREYICSLTALELLGED
jgi:aminocarboxymuconate-semialdehyde decarboxylase